MWTQTAGALTGSQLPEKGSEEEVEGSSSDITLSDTDLSDEARDEFDPSKSYLFLQNDMLL